MNFPTGGSKREMTVKEARMLFEKMEIDKIASDEDVIKESIRAAEEVGYSHYLRNDISYSVL